MRSKRVRRLSFLLLFVVIVYGAYSVIVDSLQGAQEQSKAEMKQEESFQDWAFMRLRDERDSLEKEIRDTEKSLDSFMIQQAWLNDVVKYTDELTERQKDKDTPKDIISALKWKIKDAKVNAGTTDSLDQVNSKINDIRRELKQKRVRKDKIETEMSRRIDIEKPKQSFKTQISGYFTILIGLVIIGFFVVAFRDEIVRREIFSGQAGIQFITLFSLVIAIILFGITGILEGKELAALLGGLSGYILGRTTSARTEPAQPKTPVLSSPAITDISPNEITVGATDTVKIVGHGLQLANSVKIVQGANEVLVSDITSNDLLITCKVALDANQPKGKYDIIVTNSDGAVAKLPQALTVK